MLARNARPVLRAVAQRLRAAPSLPYTDPVTETVEGLAPVEDYTAQFEVTDLSPAGVVRGGVLALALELNMLLPAAAEHARKDADRQACREGTGLAYELSCCWEGRLRSFLNASRRDL